MTEDEVSPRVYMVESTDPLTGKVELRRITLTEILTRCAELSGCTPADVRGPSRHRTIVEARAEFCRRGNAAGYSWPLIGKHIGGRTAQSCMKVAKRIRKNSAKPLPFWGSTPHEEEKKNQQ